LDFARKHGTQLHQKKNSNCFNTKSKYRSVEFIKDVFLVVLLPIYMVLSFTCIFLILPFVAIAGNKQKLGRNPCKWLIALLGALLWEVVQIMFIGCFLVSCAGIVVGLYIIEPIIIFSLGGIYVFAYFIVKYSPKLNNMTKKRWSEGNATEFRFTARTVV